MNESVVNWNAELMRFTVFFADSPIDQHKTWWSAFTEKTPDESRSKPQQGEYIDSGEFRDGVLELRITQDRADWILRPNGAMMMDIPSIGEFDNELSYFKERFITWFSQVNLRITRIAFGAILLKEEESRSEGYKTISNFLPGVPLIENGWREFNLQFNKPVPFDFDRIGNLQINRITNFSVIDMQIFTVHPTSAIVHKFMSRLEFDISTPVSAERLFDSHELIDVTKTLVDIEPALKNSMERTS